MSENESIKFFLRIVQEKHEQLKSHLTGLLQALALENHDERIRANAALLQTCENLSQILSTSDRPQWLSAILDATTQYNQHHNVSGQSYRLLSIIIQQQHNAVTHFWSFENSNNEADYNFDSLYQRLREESKLQQLFESMVITLERMVSSGEIDSLTALKSLEQLIAVIKQNQRGSYFSVMASWEFISNFTKNLVWQELSNLPGIKQLKSAFEKTAKEMNIELDNLHTSIATEMKKKYSTTINSLTHKEAHNVLPNHKSSTDAANE